MDESKILEVIDMREKVEELEDELIKLVENKLRIRHGDNFKKYFYLDSYDLYVLGIDMKYVSSDHWEDIKNLTLSFEDLIMSEEDFQIKVDLEKKKQLEKEELVAKKKTADKYATYLELKEIFE